MSQSEVHMDYTPVLRSGQIPDMSTLGTMRAWNRRVLLLPCHKTVTMAFRALIGQKAGGKFRTLPTQRTLKSCNLFALLVARASILFVYARAWEGPDPDLSHSCSTTAHPALILRRDPIHTLHTCEHPY